MNREHPLKKFYAIIDKGDIKEKLEHLPSFPRIIEFEITNHCNFHCLMCKTGVGVALRERGFMTIETYEKIIDEIKGKGVALKFVGQGEPTLHKGFIEFVNIAKRNGVICHLTTNGSMLNEEMMQEIIESGLDSVKFSFQGVDAEGYRMLRQNDDFEILLEKIKKLYSMRGNNPAPYITVTTSVTNETQHQIDDFKEHCQPFCDKVEVGITNLEFIDLDKLKDKETKNTLQKIQMTQDKEKKRYKCCNQVFDTITIRWNGDITSCCADNDGIMTLGNIHQKSIEECWNSPLQNKFREILSENRYNDLPLCKNCYDYMGYM